MLLYINLYGGKFSIINMIYIHLTMNWKDRGGGAVG